MWSQDIETPAVVVDLDKLGANIERLQKTLSGLRLANRPHIKTHRIPEIAQMQVKAGAVGITCQKLAEAEVMADAGLKDIFLPYNIVGEAKLARLAKLARRVKLSVTADSEVVVEGLSQTMHREKLTLPVLVEFDTGLGRCGVQYPEEARALARLIASSQGLAFAGLMTHPHNEKSDPFVRETRSLLKEDGIRVEQVSYGGTPGIAHLTARREATEYRAGVYVFGDRDCLARAGTRLDECSFRVLATVVSRPTADRAILDAGSKSLTSDLLGLEGYGYITEYPDARLNQLSEEHGWVDLSQSAKKPSIGERVSIIPNHACPVTNLFDQVLGLRGDKVELIWRVAARGASQ